MAIDPVFLTRVVLESRLRLSKAHQQDAESQIDNAIKKVRVGFYKSLPASVISALLATASSDNPSSVSEIDRALAESIEVDWVRKELLCTMPVLFADGAGGVDQQYNEDGLTRTASLGDLDRILDKLCESIQQGIEDLGGELPSVNSGLHATCIGPDTTPPMPYDSLFTVPVEDEI